DRGGSARIDRSARHPTARDHLCSRVGESIRGDDQFRYGAVERRTLRLASAANLARAQSTDHHLDDDWANPTSGLVCVTDKIPKQRTEISVAGHRKSDNS